MNKPNGLFLITPTEAEAFVEQLPIEQFHGIGPVTANKMHQLGILKGADLKQWPEADLIRCFGKVGQFFSRIARAQDDRPVNPNRERKSIGVETSFAVDLDSHAAAIEELGKLVQQLKDHLDQQEKYGRTLTLKVKYADYQQITRSRTVTEPIEDAVTIAALAEELLSLTQQDDRKIRLLGLSVAGFKNADNAVEYEQLRLNILV